MKSLATTSSAVLALVTAAPILAQSPNLASPEMLTGTPIFGPSAGTQQTPAICRGAGMSLMVFEDNRGGDRDLFGVRLDATGAPLDVVPFPITKDPGDQTAPRVEWNGQNWLVLYNNQVDPGSGYFATQIAALRVSPTALVLDPAPIALGMDDTGSYTGVATDGNNWLVVFAGFSAGNSDIRGVRISPAGAILDPSGVILQPGTFFIYFGTAVTSTGNGYLVTWHDNGTKGRRFNSNLQPIDPSPISISSSTGSFASNGTQTFFLFTKQTPIFTQQIVATRYNSNLQPLDATPIPISSVAANQFDTNPRVVWDGAQWIVSWLTYGEQIAKAARVTTAGTVRDPGGVQLPDNAPSTLYGPALGGLPSGGAVFAWSDYRYGTAQDVFGCTLSSGGIAGAERIYSTGAESMQRPRIATGPGQYLVTYRAETASGSRVLAQRVDPFGTPLDGEPLTVAAASHANLFSGSASFNGNLYLVVWSDSTDGKIYARRLLPDGNWLDSAPIFVMLGGSADVCALGTDFLVSGLRAPSYPQYIYSFGTRVSEGGAILDPTPLLLGESYATRCRLTTLGGRWLAVTESHWTHDSNQAGLLYKFIDSAGTLSAPGNAGLLNIQNWGIVDVASSPTGALLVGQTGSNWTNAEIYAARILPDGSIAKNLFNITGNDAMGQSRPTVAWTGEEFVVAYQTFQNNVWFYDFEPDVYAVRLSENATLLDANGFALFQGEDYETSVDAESLGNGRAIFGVSAYVDSGYGSTRIVTRNLRPVGLANYGTGTPGCSGYERMDALATPKVGQATFGLSTYSAPPLALGVGIVSNLQDLAGSDPFFVGALLHVAFAGATELYAVDMLSNANGLAQVAIPLPNSAALAGKQYFAQSLWAWPGAYCTLPPYQLSTSDGLSFVIQP